MKEYIYLNHLIMRKTNGFFQLEHDQSAVQAFEQEVVERFMPFESPLARLHYLIEHQYYENIFERYREDDVLALIEMVYDYGFRFQSFMAISKFYQSYALKTNDGQFYLETYEDRIVCVALALAVNDIKKATELAQAMIEQRYQPATPTFLNAGKVRAGEMVSCFLLEMDDSLNSINYVLNTCSQLSKIGGGVAINLSKLRGRNESIKGIENCSSGILPVGKLLEDTFSYVNQLGQRPGAGVAYLNVFHWDVEEFLDTKKINASEKSRLQTLSIGLIVPDKFMELAERNEKMYVFAPHTVYQALGEYLDDLDIDARYEELVAHPAIKKREIDSRKLLIHIARMQFESGYPYMVFKGNANRNHALHRIGQIKMSNLCTEIFQLQETSTINNWGEAHEIRRDISCNLGSLNIANVMAHQALESSVSIGMDALTAVSDQSQIQNAPGVEKANRELHAVGLGVMNLHGYLAKEKIAYESPLAKEFVRTFFMMINYYSLKRSMEIAKERGETFKDFEQSTYATGEYFERYLTTDYAPTTPKIQALFEGMTIPSIEDWKILKEAVQAHGLYHAYRLAIAPTQSIGYIQNATASVAPIVDVIEQRTYGDSTTYYPMPYLSMENFFFYKSAYHMDMFKMIDLIAEIQVHVDQGISTTLYVDSNTTTKELCRYYIYAYKKGLKALYYTRTKNLGFDECVACAV